MSTTNTYENDILQWRGKKYDDLVRKNGWLALAGLNWLKEAGISSVQTHYVRSTSLGIIEKKGKFAFK